MKGNLVLCGFMGCGKTSVGRRVAKLLSCKLCDLDRYIEEREGMAITEIFEKFGEAGFRQREAQAVEEVARQGGMVVASGGGTVLFPHNVELFHQNGSTILFLDVPLLQKPNRRQVIEELFNQRIPLYRAAADITVDAGAPPVVVARRIVELGL